MAEAGQQRAVTAAFPPPPPFWKHFTTQNLKKLEEHKREAESREGRKAWTPAALRALELPQELRYLVPPEAPSSGTYALFGEPQSVSINLPSLEEQGIEQLYPSPPAGSENALPPNHRFYLLKISKSLLLNFLEFVGLLSISPERFEEKLEHIRNLFINAHHLLNLYRPHQARESLILMMEEQLANAREEIKEMDRIKERVGTFLEQLEAEGREKDVGTAASKATEDADKTHEEEKRVEEARALWKLVNEVDEP